MRQQELPFTTAVIVDQFEELYTLVPDARERLAFTACLSGIADDATTPNRDILSIRSDFLDRVPEDEQFMGELSQGLYFLTAPNREGLRDALGPALDELASNPLVALPPEVLQDRARLARMLQQ